MKHTLGKCNAIETTRLYGLLPFSTMTCIITNKFTLEWVKLYRRFIIYAYFADSVYKYDDA